MPIQLYVIFSEIKNASTDRLAFNDIVAMLIL
jgi:hypothetical protein